MARPRLEVADVFRAHGAAWRKANAGHVSLAQFKVMSAIETCRTAALGGHVERCEDCAHERVAYNSCRNRHCPKCQAAAARRWLENREAELLPDSTSTFLLRWLAALLLACLLAAIQSAHSEPQSRKAPRVLQGLLFDALGSSRAHPFGTPAFRRPSIKRAP